MLSTSKKYIYKYSISQIAKSWNCNTKVGKEFICFVDWYIHVYNLYM